MNAWTIYWWTRLDKLSELFDIITVLYVLALIGVSLFWGFSTIDGDAEWSAKCRKLFKTYLRGVLIFGALSTFTPNSKEFAMMYVLPKVINSQCIQKDFPELYDLAMKAIKEKLEKTLGENK